MKKFEFLLSVLVMLLTALMLAVMILICMAMGV